MRSTTPQTDPGVGRRGAWMFADQIGSSASSLVIGVVAARTLSPAAFGVFAVLFTIVLLLRDAVRSAVLDPMIILEAELVRGGQVAGATLASVAAGSAGGCLVAFGLWALGEGWAVASAAGAAVAAVLLADSARMSWIVIGRPERSAMTSLATLGTLIGGWLWSPPGSLAGVCGLLGVSGAVGAAVSWSRLAVSGWSVGLERIREWAHLGAALVVDLMASVGVGAVVIFALAAIDTVEAGAFRAAQMLFAPAVLFHVAAVQVVTAELARARNDRGVTMRLSLVISLAAAMVVVTVVGAVFWVLVPALVELVLADVEAVATPLIWPMALFVLTAVPSLLGSAILRVVGDRSDVVRPRLAMAAPLLVAMLAGALLGGAGGAALAGTAVQLATAPLWWRLTRRRLAAVAVSGDQVARLS